jgi:hypothetical protein
MIEGNGFGFAVFVIGGGLFIFAILGIITCQITKGSLFDLNPIVGWMLIFGALGVGYGSMMLLRGDVKE